MSFNKPLLDGDMQAYVDGELDGRRLESLTHQLLHSPEGALKVAAWQEQNKAIKAAFASVISEPIPFSLNFDDTIGGYHPSDLHFAEQNGQASTLYLPRSLVRRTSLMCVAFILGMLAAFGAMLGLGYSQFPVRLSLDLAKRIDIEQDFAKRTTAALEDFINSPETAPARITEGTKSALVLPSLTPEGFVLAGLRIFPKSGTNMACLFYSKPKMLPITLCVEPASEEFTKMRTFGTFPKASVSWRQMGAVYGLSGPLPETELHHLAGIVISEIESFGPPPKLSPTH